MANIEFTPTSGVAYGSEFKDGNKAWITSPIAIATNAPLDARLQVPNFAALTAENTWKLNSVGSGNQGMNTAYYGMLTYVATDSDESLNGLYVLTSKTGSVVADKLDATAWVKISKTNAELKDIVANLIDTETYITIPSINNGQATTIADALSAIISLTPSTEGLEELNNRVSALESTLSTSLTYQVIDSTEKPTEPKEGVIYLINTETTSEDNIREEWLYINNAWEKIGTTSVNLDNYYDKTSIDTILSNKADKTAVDGLSEKVTSLEEVTKDLNVTELNSAIAANTKAIADNKSATDSAIADLTSSLDGYTKLDASNIPTENVSSWREKLGIKSEQIAEEVKAVVATDPSSWRSALGVKTSAEVIEDVKADVATNASDWRSKLGVKSSEEITTEIADATKVEVLVTEENKASWRSALGIGDGSTLKNIADRTIVVDEEKVDASGIVVATKKYMDIYEIKTSEAISIEVAADTCILTSVNGANIMETTISKIGDTFIATHEILGGEDFIEPLSLEEDEDSNLLITYQAPIGTLVEVVYFK